MDGSPLTRYVFGKRLDHFRPEMLPRAYFASSRWNGEDFGWAVWRQLAQGLLMAMVWFVLRDENDMWFAVEVFQGGYARLGCLFGDGEDAT